MSSMPPTEASSATMNGDPANVVPGPQKRVGVVRYDDFFNQRTFSRELRKTKKSTREKRKKTRRNAPVLIVRRVINSRGQLSEVAIDIMSENLRDILRTIHEKDDQFTISDSKPEVDFKILFRSRMGLQARLVEEQKKEQPDESTLFELETILNFIQEDYGSRIAEFDKLISDSRITFEWLWAIFEPDCPIYRLHPLLNQHQVMRLEKVEYKRSRDGIPYLSVEYKIVVNDGKRLGYYSEGLQISYFTDTVKIEDLPTYPLDHHQEKEVVRRHVLDRGRRYAEIKRHLFQTEGIALSESGARFRAYGRVMIDPETFEMFESSSPVHQYVRKGIANTENMADDDLIICSPGALGFCFGTKTWGAFALENLEEVEWSDSAFDTLVLDPGRKKIIHALIEQHYAHKESFDDFIVGKGKGLIGLLCGNPGCGKTLTAEAVAEVTKKPLYVVGAGELGTSASSVERQLNRVFKLAHRWDIVVLLDEADVFLHRRSAQALEQNALVAVFLRLLEYYQGILMMTTNMNENFDPAFESRIHFCMRYADLDHASRKNIWKTFLDRALKGSNYFTEEQHSQLATNVLNGRQIKNVVSVAQSLAAKDKENLSMEHLNLVFQTKDHWDKNKSNMYAADAPKPWGSVRRWFISALWMLVLTSALLLAFCMGYHVHGTGKLMPF